MKCPLCESTELREYDEMTSDKLEFQCQICEHIFVGRMNDEFDLTQINSRKVKDNNFFKSKLVVFKKLIPSLKNFILFAILAIVLILVTRFNNDENPPMLLAKELLSGRPYLPEKISWIEMLEWKGHHYIAYPPMLTYLVLPYILMGGIHLGSAALNSLFIFGSAILMFLLVKNLEGIKQWASLAAIAYVLGTTNLQSAHIGSVWLLMHSQGNFFLLLSLWLFISKRTYFWAGLSFAIAFQVRYAILAAIFIFPLYAFIYFNPRPKILQWIWFIVGMLPACLSVWAFQWWTLDNPFTSPYTIAWQQWGPPEHIFSLNYLQNNLKIYFLGIPTILNQFPYLRFEYEGQAMWVISPFFLGLLLLNYKQGFIKAFFPSAILMLVAYLCYFHTGYTQYGTRYVQDIFPLLIPLAFSGFNRRKYWIRLLLPIAVLISCLINIYAFLFCLNIA